jgi:Ca2+-binding RTX toxin-like protein
LCWSTAIPGSPAAALSTSGESTFETRATLDEPVPGPEALLLLESELTTVAVRNGVSPARLVQALESDTSAWVDQTGRVFYVEPAAPASLEAPSTAPYPYEDTFALHSKPGSKRTIYLDFDGHTVSGTAWQAAYSLAEPTTVMPFDSDGNPAGFSDMEKDKIQSIWQRVAEDYAPFDVDVTTEDPGVAALNRASLSDKRYGNRVLITDSPAFCGCGGVAYVGSFDDVGGFYQPAWVFSNSLGDSSKNIAEAASHEAGHNMGLLHDGNGSTSYYGGHGIWAPIMGIGYYQPVTQFSKGEYDGANQPQDDLVVMASNGLKEMSDDHADGKKGSTLITHSREGVISSEDDSDIFRFVAPSDGAVTIVVDTAPVSPNLDVRLRIRKPGWAIIKERAPVAARVSNDVASGLGAKTSLSVEEGKKYYLEISGDSLGTPSSGYSNYGSLGQYTVSVIGVTNDKLVHSGHFEGLSGTRVGSNVGATKQPGEAKSTCASDGKVNSVWWTWTATTTGTGVVDTFGSGFDTVLTVYEGGKVGELGEVEGGCNDDASGTTNRSKVIFDFLVGNVYRVRVDGVGPAVGKVKLSYRVSNQLFCNGLPATVVGEKHAEKIVGTAGADVIVGLGGADVIKGKAGADIICGNGGSDVMTGGAGADIIVGGSGSDTLTGSGGWDVCRGGAGLDLGGSGCEVTASIP